MIFGNLKTRKIGLVLGGGVARGLAHIGVLKVIEQYKIPIDYIAATSSGSIIGGAYASGMEPRLIEDIALKINWGSLLRISFFRPGFISGSSISEMIVKYIGNKTFSELKIPLIVVAADIKTGEPYAFHQGRIAPAIAASSSVPGIIAPHEVGTHLLVDGGLADNLPVGVAKEMGANFVIAVDVVPYWPMQRVPSDAFQMYGRAFDIITHKLAENQRKAADLLIEPHLNEDASQLDLAKAKKFIEAGEAAAHQALRNLRRDYR